MKKLFAYSLLMALIICSCQVDIIEDDVLETAPEVIHEAKVFTAIIEDSTSGETKTSLDASGNVLWKQGDQVSIFAGSTVNEQYQVTDASEGKTAASLNKVGGGGFVAGTELDNNVAFYPYASTAELTKSGSNYVISEIELPATQTYAADSFGNGAFPMAAVTSTTEDMNLKFKNVLGGLKLQLKGTATITSITVTGNNNEILCGDAEVTTTYGGVPSIVLTDASAKTVTLDCGAGVTLDSETATPFIIALPPMTMTGGFTVVVTDSESKQMEIKTTKSQTIPRSNLLKMPAVNYVGTALAPPLKFTSTGTTSISLIQKGSPDAISLDYKVDDGEWTSYTIEDAIDLTDGQELSFRAGTDGNASFSQSTSNYYRFTITGSGTVAASGNIMSLLNKEGGFTIPAAYCFCCLFSGCDKMTTAPGLPATTLADFCYYLMFSFCSSLTATPELPATILSNSCYRSMFQNCSNLATPPELPATTLANDCYSNMFSKSGLTIAPELPATTLAQNCYYGMFYQCGGLTTAPELPATTLAQSCYYSMFNGCGHLTTAPELPATTLAGGCYGCMFQDCSNLTTAPDLPATTLATGCYIQMFMNTRLTAAPELPATTLANSCYYNMFRNSKITAAPDLPATTLAESCYSCMFYDCDLLTTVPNELPATTLASSCYNNMFHGCSSITRAPVLPATTLANYCYSNMFYGCSNLTIAPELPATTLANYCYQNMFSLCTNLASAPELPATTLVTDCYREMFSSCFNLNYVKALFTTTPSDSYTKNWLAHVSDIGTFVKSSSATWDVTGVNGIPSGWTIQTE